MVAGAGQMCVIESKLFISKLIIKPLNIILKIFFLLWGCVILKIILEKAYWTFFFANYCWFLK